MNCVASSPDFPAGLRASGGLGLCPASEAGSFCLSPVTRSILLKITEVYSESYKAEAKEALGSLPSGGSKGEFTSLLCSEQRICTELGSEPQTFATAALAFVIPDPPAHFKP